MDREVTLAARTSRELLADIRERLQSAHFTARGISLHGQPDAKQPVADQLHAIRLLAEELDARLGA